MLQEKPAFNKFNFVTFKENKSFNPSHGLIACELDIDTINCKNMINFFSLNK